MICTVTEELPPESGPLVSLCPSFRLTTEETPEPSSFEVIWNKILFNLQSPVITNSSTGKQQLGSLLKLHSLTILSLNTEYTTDYNISLNHGKGQIFPWILLTSIKFSTSKFHRPVFVKPNRAVRLMPILLDSTTENRSGGFMFACSGKKLLPLCQADYFLLHVPGTVTFFSLSIAVVPLFH